MITPSAGFVRSLELLDPLLDVYWGEYAHQWVITRKAYVPRSEIGYLKSRFERLSLWVRDPNHPQKDKVRATYVGVAEEYKAARAGRRVVLFVKELSPKVYDYLCMSDIHRYGGYSRYADEIERQEIRAEEDRRRMEENELNAVNKETYDMLNFIWRHKETQLLHGERDMNKLLHGEKKNRPVIETSLR